MKGLENQDYVLLLAISNTIAILLLLAALWWPRIARILFFLLFSWACWINWTTSQRIPDSYLEYADLTWSGWYRNFITGWFANNIQLAVGSIAACQGLIAVSMLLKGWIFKMGIIGAILFFLSILPLGVGSGFPCTAIMAVAMLILTKKDNIEFIWEKSTIAKRCKT